MTTEEYLNIDTPENVVFSYDVAGIGSRFLAALIDTSLIAILEIGIILVIGTLIGSLGDLSEESTLINWMLALTSLLTFVVLWGYYVFFEMLWNGQSPGKRWVGLRVIRSDGTPITLVGSIIRNLVRIMDFLPISYGVGVVTMFVDKQSRRLGDLAAGTLVVRDHRDLTLEKVAPSSAQAARIGAMSPVDADLPVERLTHQDLAMVDTFLQRRDDLSNASAIARRIVQALLERMEVTPEQVSAWSDDEIIQKIRQLADSQES